MIVIFPAYPGLPFRTACTLSLERRMALVRTKLGFVHSEVFMKLTWLKPEIKGYPQRTFFEDVYDSGKEFKIYFGDFPSSLGLSRLRSFPGHFHVCRLSPRSLFTPARPLPRFSPRPPNLHSRRFDQHFYSRTPLVLPSSSSLAPPTLQL